MASEVKGHSKKCRNLFSLRTRNQHLSWQCDTNSPLILYIKCKHSSNFLLILGLKMGWEHLAWRLSPTFPLTDYSVAEDKPQIRLCHLRKEEVGDSEIDLILRKKSGTEKKRGGCGPRMKAKNFTMEGVGWVETIGNVVFITDIRFCFSFNNYAYM